RWTARRLRPRGGRRWSTPTTAGASASSSSSRCPSPSCRVRTERAGGSGTRSSGLPVGGVRGAAPGPGKVGAGRVFESRGGGDWVWGIALGHSFGSVEALAEGFSTHGDDAVSRQSLVNLGGRGLVSGGSRLLVSGGWGLSGGGGPRHAFFYLGLQLTSDEKRTP